MRSANHSSRQRFTKYKTDLKDRIARGDIAPKSRFAPPGQSAPQKRQRSFLVLLRAFFGLMGEHRPMMALALTSLTISVMLGLIPPYGTKLVFDTALGGKPLSPGIPRWLHVPAEPRMLLAYIAIGSVVLAAVSQSIGLWGRWQATRMTKLMQVSVRKRVFEHAIRLPLHRVYELKSGGAPSLIREDAGAVGELIFAMIYGPWRAITQLVGILAILSMTSWKLLVGSLVIIPLVWLSHRTWVGRIRPIFSDIRATRTHTDAHTTETFSGIRVVRGFSRQHGEANRFIRNQGMISRQEILAWWWSRTIEVAWGLLIPTAMAILLWFGGNMVIRGEITLGELVLFLTYLMMLLGPLEALASSATAFQNNLAGLDRVLNLLAEAIDLPNKPGARVISRAAPPGRIVMRDVGYAYPNTPTPVLHDVNLEAEPGEMIALVGPSGAGKTTLCNLIARFYDPTAGSITYDGTDLRDINVDSFRSLLGIVEQDTFLFDGSIADNIAYGRRYATMEEVVASAKRANADEFITKLPKGYESLIGERGVKLSGGQRQRLTIARALLADPRILILDEATSNLDSESERLIQNSLRTLMAGRTSFVIAHRLSTIAHAHRIVVVEQGRIVEMGPHAELMERSGRYRQMVELQTAATPPVVEKVEGIPETPVTQKA